MKKSVAFLLAAALSQSVSAGGIKIDLGNFPARNCIQVSIPNNSAEGDPQYKKRFSRVTGEVLLESISQLDESIVMRCAERARDELRDSFSSSNIDQFELLFQKYIFQCARVQNPNIRIIRAFVKQQESCRDN